MVEIRLSQVGKRFNRQRILENLDWDIIPGTHHVLTGPNGSGKSTLLRLIAGQTETSSGTIEWKKEGSPLPVQSWYLHLSWCAPYIGFYPDLTVRENIRLHARLRVLDTGFHDLLRNMQLEDAADKPLRQLSSGMQARFKAYLAIHTAADVYLLDEVTAMMDEGQAIRFRVHLEDHCRDKTIIFATNDPREFGIFPFRKALI